jgi:Tol biopolymer transport system component
MRRRLILLILIVIVWLAVGCIDRPFLTPTKTTITTQPSVTPESIKVSPTSTSTPTEGRPAWLQVPPENPTIIQLTDNTEWRNVKPVWSPDGSQILFMSNRECEKSYFESDLDRDMFPSCWEWDLYLMNADGSNEIRLTDVQFVDGWVAAWIRWSPDGERIAFTFANYLDTPFQKVYTFPVDRAKQIPLGLNDMEVLVDEGEDYFIGSFEWSPDGKKYAYDYFSSHEVPPRQYDIVVVDTENGEEVFRKTTLGDTLCGFGGWVPNGEAILISCFRNTRDWEYHIDWIDLNTGKQRLLIRDAHYPVWSPDGKWILFFFHKKSVVSRNVLFHLDTGEVVALPYQNELWDDRSWSPDGKWLAFGELFDPDNVKWDIFLLDMSWLEMEWDE